MKNTFYYKDLPRKGVSKSSVTPLSKQSLFESKARLRKIRVLIDEGILKQLEENSTDDPLAFYLHSNLVTIWSMSPPFPHIDSNPGIFDEVTEQRFAVAETTGNMGPFAWPGPTYGYTFTEQTDSNQSKTMGNFTTAHPEEALLAAGYDKPSSGMVKQLKDAIAVKEAALTINADIVITNTHTDEEWLQTVLGDTNFVTKGEAIAPLAHYFRTQGDFTVGLSPHREVDSDDYYLYAVYAYCPHIRHWTGKIDRAIEFQGDKHSIHAFYADTAISRCSRALRRYDDLLVYLGQPVSKTSVDDAIDAVDHILVSLCAAIDSLARSLNEIFDVKAGLPKLHDRKWIKKSRKPIYGNVPEYEKLINLVPHIEFLFKVRNSIHSLGLMPYFEENSSGTRYVNRIQIVIPPTSQDSWDKLQGPDRTSWNLEISGSVAHVDLLSFVQKCFKEAFSFIDVLCEIISFEQVEEISGLLFENVWKVIDESGLAMSKFIAATGSLPSPLITGDYNPDNKRRLESDEESKMTQESEALLRSMGWKPRPDFKALRQPPIITYRHGSTK